MKINSVSTWKMTVTCSSCKKKILLTPDKIYKQFYIVGSTQKNLYYYICKCGSTNEVAEKDLNEYAKSFIAKNIIIN